MYSFCVLLTGRAEGFDGGGLRRPCRRRHVWGSGSRLVSFVPSDKPLTLFPNYEPRVEQDAGDIQRVAYFAAEFPGSLYRRMDLLPTGLDLIAWDDDAEVLPPGIDHP
jgi:hypothetical protein